MKRQVRATHSAQELNHSKKSPDAAVPAAGLLHVYLILSGTKSRATPANPSDPQRFGFDHEEQAIGDQANGDGHQQVRPVGLLLQRFEAAIEPG